eukprot:NODE_5506_length_645_cov_23.277992_g5342_i0.p1 GENE.NODE_5506_length_645_cov_23.277992_g5342_i0~~NODE_5506_length_645_cov_23.277992_g5342_i0.p1  ORF type:complete len:197 (+),score=16.54 NODE_5506_length_645_cov_23.277992_g5342_i0:48-593(+)
MSSSQRCTAGGYIRDAGLGNVSDPWGDPSDPNTMVLAEGHYDHGDLWHHNHRRHHHLFHDHHYIQGASEDLNLEGSHRLTTSIIPNPSGAQSLSLNPETLGKWAFSNGAAQYGFSTAHTPTQPRFSGASSCASNRNESTSQPFVLNGPNYPSRQVNLPHAPQARGGNGWSYRMQHNRSAYN